MFSFTVNAFEDTLEPLFEICAIFQAKEMGILKNLMVLKE